MALNLNQGGSVLGDHGGSNFSWHSHYTYRQRFSDDPNNEFTDNRFMLRFNAAKPFRW